MDTLIVASFAATTLDTATRLQRYVIQELGKTVDVKPLQNKYVATGLAVAGGLAMAMIKGPKGYGSGGLHLWPVFGATNQLLGCLAFAVIIIYLRRKGMPSWFVMIPAIFMLIMPGWAMVLLLSDWFQDGKWLLFVVGILVELMAVWLLIETALVWQKAKGNYPDLPPLPGPESPNENES